jgi:hypothetical protein
MRGGGKRLESWSFLGPAIEKPRTAELSILRGSALRLVDQLDAKRKIKKCCRLGVTCLPYAAHQADITTSAIRRDNRCRSIGRNVVTRTCKHYCMGITWEGRRMYRTVGKKNDRGWRFARETTSDVEHACVRDIVDKFSREYLKICSGRQITGSAICRIGWRETERCTFETKDLRCERAYAGGHTMARCL